MESGQAALTLLVSSDVAKNYTFSHLNLKKIKAYVFDVRVFELSTKGRQYVPGKAELQLKVSLFLTCSTND